MKRRGIVGAVAVCLLFAAASPAEASLGGGLAKIIGGVFQLPLGILGGTLSGPPVVGTLIGAVQGAFSTVGMLTGGTLELAASAVPIAKAAAPYVLPFLFL